MKLPNILTTKANINTEAGRCLCRQALQAEALEEQRENFITTLEKRLVRNQES